jgi:hypothetical protein
MDQVLTAIWTFLNSSFGITCVLSALAAGLNFVYGKAPWLSKYEGTMVAAVKYAEKQIPDGSANQSLARLDAALKFAVKIIEARENRQLAAPELAEVSEKLGVVHAQAEANGVL